MDELEQSNVVMFPPRHAEPLEAPPIFLPLDSVEGARHALCHIEVAAELAQRILAKAPAYGEAEALTAVMQVMDALWRVLDSAQALAASD